MIGGLIHKLCLESGAPGIYLQNRGSRRIVPAVDGAGFAAVQMGSIASETDQVNHCAPNSTAPLRSRLCYGRGSATVAALLRSRLCLTYPCAGISDRQFRHAQS